MVFFGIEYSCKSWLSGKKITKCINPIPEKALSTISPRWGLVFMRAKNAIDMYAALPLKFHLRESYKFVVSRLKLLRQSCNATVIVSYLHPLKYIGQW